MSRTARRAGLLILLAASSVVSVAAAATPADQLKEARRLLESGNAEQALRVLEPLARGKDPLPEGLLLRSSAQILLGDAVAARKDLERAVELDPTLREAWLNLAGLDLAAKNYDAALGRLTAAEKLDPAAPDNHLNIGAVLLLQGKLEPASERFTRHLAAQPNSEEAEYLVASNYALAGYGALALEHLRRSIARNERVRLRARTDANFLALENNPQYQEILVTDSYQPAADALRASQLYALQYDGDGRLLAAVISALQALRQPFDARVEVTPDWALLWGEFRIKVSPGQNNRGLVEVSAPAGAFTAVQWQQRTERLFREILIRLPA